MYIYFAVPKIPVEISAGNAILGQNHDLICNVPGAEKLNPNITYQWTKNNITTQTQVGTNSNTLSFSSLRLSDAGWITCTVSINSDYLDNKITQNNTIQLTIQGKLNLSEYTH